MTLGKAITLFLIDATPTGRIAAELSNWTGKAYKLPRKSLQENSDREDLRKAGVYFLFGRDENDAELLNVYVGEAEDVYTRLTQHREKDFWSEAVAFISKDENLNKAHVKFLEHHAITTIQNVKRANLKNGNTPTCPVLSELEQAVMLEFFENLKLLTSSLGYKVFDSISNSQSKNPQDIYVINAARGAKAKAVLSNEGIVVLKGSVAANSITPSAASWVTNTRERLLETSVLEKRDNAFLFVEDHLFSSPSTAAAIVMGRSANGLQEWKDKQGKSLKEKNL